MIAKELIDRINELSQKQRQTGLSDAEKSEQTLLRRHYLDSIKEQVRGQLAAARFRKSMKATVPAAVMGD